MPDQRIRGGLMSNIRAFPMALALVCLPGVGVAQTSGSEATQPEPKAEAKKPRVIRTLMVIDDPDGGAITRQLSLSAMMLYAGMADQDDELGLFVEAAEPIRMAPKPLSEAGYFAKLRSELRGLGSPEPTRFASSIDFLVEAFGAPREETADAIIIVAHAPPDDGAAATEIPSFVSEKLKERRLMTFVVTLGPRAKPDLYKPLVDATGGEVYQVVRGSDLKRAFSSIFALLHKTELLPIVGNKVVLDESISKATVILPKKKKTDRNKIVTPGERVLGAKTKYPGVEWKSFAEYDLVRIENPEAGAWRIRQPPGADEVVGHINESGIRLEVQFEPRQPMVNGLTVLKAYLADGEGVIDAYSKLKHLVIEAEVTDPSGRMKPFRLERRTDGVFSSKVPNELSGYHQVKLTAFSPELQRQRKLSYLVDPACFKGQMDADLRKIFIDMSPTCPRFNELYAILRVYSDDKFMSAHNFERDGRRLSVAIPSPELSKSHKLEVIVKGKTMDGYVVESDGNGPYEDKAREATMADFIAAVGKRLFVLNVPLVVGLLGVLALRHVRKSADRGDDDWEENS